MPTVSLDDIRPLRAFLDPHGGQSGQSASRLKKVASQAAIVVGGRDDRNYYFLDAWSARCSTDVLVEKMFAMHARWNVEAFGGESNGLAGLFMDAFMREAAWRKTPFPLVKVPQPTHIQKPYRIRTALQPVIGHGRFFYREPPDGPEGDGIRTLLDQIAGFPLIPLWDLIDCAASLVRFFPTRSTRVERSDETAAKLRYMRNSGASPAAIAAVAAGRTP